MIIITGANGNIGHDIVQRLVKQIGAQQVGVSVREPEKASALHALGVRVRQGNFKDTASLRHAFEGALQVLIVSINTAGANTVAQHNNAIEAAKSVGAERILYTSHMGANPQSLFAPMVDHAATEELLVASQIPFTVLRNGFYAESALPLLGKFLETGEITAPLDGPVSWTARTDLAAAAVIALTKPEQLSGFTPPLTNPTTLDLAAIADIASELIGGQISRVTVTDEQFAQSKSAAGWPPHLIHLIGGIFKASRNGEFIATDPTLERLLGRPVTSMRDVLNAHIVKQN
ncbi:SDR family oxidoreductase [bacterium]|nr:MAG: SDR family oxidoreductase [bacterium]